MPSKILLVGGGGREDAIARRIVESGSQLYSAMKNRNPSIISLSRDTLITDELNHPAILEFALAKGVDLAFIGPDPVLDTPLADTLMSRGVRVASPTRLAARIETSKAYMRELLTRYEIAGNLEYHEVKSVHELETLILDSTAEYAIKPTGLTGGKGVRVMGIQLETRNEAFQYAKEILERDGIVLLEEKISGEEFSQMVFTDGTHMIPMPLAQDFKRAFEGDMGPNTGGMGSITDSDHLLPFIDSGTREKALQIIASVINAMRSEGNEFRGIMYGQFMKTAQGPKVVEINARFADPEGINVLSISSGNFTEMLYSIADGNLRKSVSFRNSATVLKYVVPLGYGIDPKPGKLEIDRNFEEENLKMYYASVSGTRDNVMMTSSRALAVVGIADHIWDASDTVEDGLKKIHGEYYVRHDIGTREMIQRKIRQS
ncbi:MAG: phosphoribosylamine--glycine ligase [Thermoplasmataceae archaeon]